MKACGLWPRGALPISSGRVSAGLLLASLLLAGCSSLAPVRLDEALATPPTLGLGEADRFEALAAGPDATQPAADELHWWRQFDDPALAHWVEAALQGEVGVALAAERVQQAQALLQAARAQRGPRLTVQADATLQLRRQGDERRLQPGAAVSLDQEVDLWGGLALSERSAAAGLLRSQDLAQAARLAAASLAARAYIEWQLALQDQALLAQARALQADSLRIVGVRVEAGLAPLLDRERALAELSSTEAEQAAAAVRARQAAAALQVLAGQRPRPAALLRPAGGTVGDADDAAGSAAAPAAAAALPRWQGTGPQGRPLDLLRLRPDLRAAEHALLAAAAETGVAQAALRPRLRLPGSLVLGTLGGGGALEVLRASLAAVLDLTLFDSGAADAQVLAARSRAREAALLYRQTLLQALQQVEDAASAGQGARARVQARERGSAAGRAAEAQAQTLYRAGLTGFSEVLDAQRTALDNQRALLQARADDALAAVSLFEALGWMAPAAPASARPAAAGAV